MGNRAPVHRTVQKCSIYFQGVCPTFQRDGPTKAVPYSFATWCSNMIPLPPQRGTVARFCGCLMALRRRSAPGHHQQDATERRQAGSKAVAFSDLRATYIEVSNQGEEIAEV